MDYKSKLQTNNTNLGSNNVDLQAILNTINTLPEAADPINLDTEITAQEGLIDQIQAALEGKANNNGIDTSVTANITENDVANYPSSLTISELMGAKCFIIQGNYLSEEQTHNMNTIDDAGAIYQIIYLNGLIIDTVVTTRGSISSAAGSASMLCGRINSNGYVFNEDTGTISVNNDGDRFFKISTDTSTTGIVYTVYRIG